MESRDASAKGFDLGLFGASSVVPRIPVYKPPPISGLFITVKAYVGPIAWITAAFGRSLIADRSKVASNEKEPQFYIL